MLKYLILILFIPGLHEVQANKTMNNKGIKNIIGRLS